LPVLKIRATITGMTHGFDKDYWEQHWQQASGAGPAPNPYLDQEVGGLPPGTALDAGCGAGAEALWLAAHGWQVTAADIATTALARVSAGPAAGSAGSAATAETAESAKTAGSAGSAANAQSAGPAERPAGAVRWVEADLTVWAPEVRFDLVMTHYAHPAMPQLAFYERIAGWVAPGGSLLIVGHLHGHHHHPAEATVTRADITAAFDPAEWEIVTAAEHTRVVPGHGGPLSDVVVRARRTS
jgi:SAM-dependent methyltransferase